MDAKSLGFLSHVHSEDTVAGSTFGFGGLFPLLGGFLLGTIFLVGVGGVVFVVLLLLFSLVEIVLVSLVKMSVCLRPNA